LPPNFEVVQNRAKFCMFLALKFFGEDPPQILDRDYKTERSSEHRAKFLADWSTELGDYARKIKENICHQNICMSSRKLSFPGELIISQIDRPYVAQTTVLKRLLLLQCT